MPEIAGGVPTSNQSMEREQSIGVEVACLHIQLTNYPQPVNSYIEAMMESISGEMNLPDQLASALKPHVKGMADLFTGLPQQLIHGDLTPENIMINGSDSVPGFIDFEHLPMGPRIWDIAKYSSRRLRTRWWGNNAPEDEDRLYRVQEFLRGYTTLTPLEASEKVALPATILAANVVEVSYSRDVAQGKLPRRMLPDHDEVLMDSIEAASWHIHNFDLVQESIHEVLFAGKADR